MKIAIIPARGGSKRIKNKNIVDFLGKPLIYYSLQVAKESGLFDQIHVSTDSEEIKDAVESLGFSVDFMRDPVLADDYVGTLPVVRWVLQTYQKRQHHYDDVCLILPTAPLIEPDDLRNSYQLFESLEKKHSILPVASYPAPIEWAFYQRESGVLDACQPNMFQVRSQDLEKKYFDSGTFVWFSKEHVLSDALAGDEGFAAYVLDRYKAIDINDMEDLEFARVIKLGLQCRT